MVKAEDAAVVGLSSTNCRPIRTGAPWTGRPTPSGLVLSLGGVREPIYPSSKPIHSADNHGPPTPIDALLYVSTPPADVGVTGLRLERTSSGLAADQGVSI